MFKGVLFDLDGVITDTAEFHYRVWGRLGDRTGVPLGRSFSGQLKGVSREDFLTLLLAHGEGEEQFSKTEFLELAKRKDDYYLEMIQSIIPKDVLPGILELLKDLRTNNIRISLASTSKNGPFLLAKMGLEGYFDTIAGPTKVANREPEPDTFLLATREAGLTPRDCIGIEDSRAGIAAITASGVQPIDVGCSGDLGEGIPVVPDTASLIFDYLKKTQRPNV